MEKPINLSMSPNEWEKFSDIGQEKILTSLQAAQVIVDLVQEIKEQTGGFLRGSVVYSIEPNDSLKVVKVAGKIIKIVDGKLVEQPLPENPIH